jgi:uncharacterized protein YbjT (DUF2867 family)
VILVTGSTGTIGSRLVELLAQSGAQVRAVLAPGQEPPWADGLGVESVRADFADTAALAEAARGASRVFVLVPPSAAQRVWQRNIIAAARHSEYVVKLSAFDSAPDTPLTMGRWHHDGEVALADSGIPHTILRPQYFMQNLLSSPSILAAGVLPTFIDAATSVGIVDALDVAAVAAALLTAADPPVEGSVVVPTGPRAVTVEDVAVELRRALARDISVDYLDPGRAREAMRTRGLPEWHIADVLYICATASDLVTDWVPRLVGRQARDVAAAADDFALDSRFRLLHPARRASGS